MIKAFRHFGIVVSDLNKMRDFYTKLGFVEESHDVESGTFIEQVVDIESAKIEWYKMRSSDGCLVELLKYENDDLPFVNYVKKSSEMGISHFAITVDNIDDACDNIVKWGGSLKNLPAISPNGKVKVVYCHDPEGGLIEMVEEL